jgi:hypothetical protein
VTINQQGENNMRVFDHNIRLTAATLLALCLSSYLYSASAHADDLRDISKVNGGIRVDANDTVGNVSSVNGGIDIRRGASAYDVETVNGGIDIEDDVEITRAETVNGGIRLGRSVKVNGSLESVNGGISSEDGSVIERGISTVNGKIRLKDTFVGEDIETSNGDIELRNGTVIEGDVIVKRNHNWFNRFFSFNRHRNSIVIDSSSAVHGDIHLYREVDLRIADGAEVGKVIEHF